jgi:hypothetical protein
MEPEGSYHTTFPITYGTRRFLSHNIPHILWNLEVHYHTHKNPKQAPLSAARKIQSIPCQPICFFSILILSFTTFVKLHFENIKIWGEMYSFFDLRLAGFLIGLLFDY